jgi:hypothetical protein
MALGLSDNDFAVSAVIRRQTDGRQFVSFA